MVRASSENVAHPIKQATHVAHNASVSDGHQESNPTLVGSMRMNMGGKT
jgi:hypothetical protein